MDNSTRLFNCARCHCQVVICRRCDRGNIYCGPQCSQPVRRESLRAAGRRYQSSRRGRFNHGERQCRYRARQQKVTHQGSATTPLDDVLGPEPTMTGTHRGPAPGVRTEAMHCDFCQRLCSPFVRLAFVPSPSPRPIRAAWPWPPPQA